MAGPIFRRIAEAALQQAGVPPADSPVPPIMRTATPATLPLHRAPTTSLLPVPVVIPAGGPTLMPDVRGLSAREAVRVLGGVGLSARLHGSGFVATQAPSPGTPIETGTWGALDLDRAAVDRRDVGGDDTR